MTNTEVIKRLTALRAEAEDAYHDNGDPADGFEAFRSGIDVLISDLRGGA